MIDSMLQRFRHKDEANFTGGWIFLKKAKKASAGNRVSEKPFLFGFAGETFKVASVLPKTVKGAYFTTPDRGRCGVVRHSARVFKKVKRGGRPSGNVCGEKNLFFSYHRALIL